jgi:transcriptional regulator NrdR family protein
MNNEFHDAFSCPRCGNSRRVPGGIRVIDSRESFGNSIIRRYKCGRCCHKWSTREVIRDKELSLAIALAGDYQI